MRGRVQKEAADVDEKFVFLFFSSLALCMQTPVEDVPGAIAPFQGRVLISVGKLLRVYDLGKKKLLRKCENKVADV